MPTTWSKAKRAQMDRDGRWTIKRGRRRPPPNIARGNATRARVRVAVEHVFAAQKCGLGLIVRSVGLARATTKLGLANLVTNMRRVVWLQSRPAPA